MKRQLLAVALVAASINALAVSEQTTLWKNGDGGIAVYRIPAICTAPNGDLVAVCDARSRNGGDLNIYQPINISCRRSSDNGATWSDPVNTWTWRWDEEEQWSGSDPSLIVDETTGTIFLFYNVWEWKHQKDIYQFFVQESKDNGATWSKPRDISKDIAFEGWNFGGMRGQGGFIFIIRSCAWAVRPRWLSSALPTTARPGVISATLSSRATSASSSSLTTARG